MAESRGGCKVVSGVARIPRRCAGNSRYENLTSPWNELHVSSQYQHPAGMSERSLHLLHPTQQWGADQDWQHHRSRGTAAKAPPPGKGRILYFSLAKGKEHRAFSKDVEERPDTEESENIQQEARGPRGWKRGPGLRGSMGRSGLADYAGAGAFGQQRSRPARLGRRHIAIVDA